MYLINVHISFFFKYLIWISHFIYLTYIANFTYHPNITSIPLNPLNICVLSVLQDWKFNKTYKHLFSGFSLWLSIIWDTMHTTHTDALSDLGLPKQSNKQVIDVQKKLSICKYLTLNTNFYYRKETNRVCSIPNITTYYASTKDLIYICIK